MAFSISEEKYAKKGFDVFCYCLRGDLEDKHINSKPLLDNLMFSIEEILNTISKIYEHTFTDSQLNILDKTRRKLSISLEETQRIQRINHNDPHYKHALNFPTNLSDMEHQGIVYNTFRDEIINPLIVIGGYSCSALREIESLKDKPRKIERLEQMLKGICDYSKELSSYLTKNSLEDYVQ